MKSFLTLLVSFLLAGLSFSADGAPQTVTPVKEWRGAGTDQALGRAAPQAVNSTEAWKKLWASWKLEGEAPTIDFTKNLVVVATTVGSSLNLNLRMGENGDLRVMAISTRDLRPGFRYVFAQVSSDGIQSINGKPVAEATAPRGGK